MFKWPDPLDGQIIVWLPFKIYLAVSGSITLILGLAMICLAKWDSMEALLRLLVRPRLLVRAGVGPVLSLPPPPLPHVFCTFSTCVANTS